MIIDYKGAELTKEQLRDKLKRDVLFYGNYQIRQKFYGTVKVRGGPAFPETETYLLCHPSQIAFWRTRLEQILNSKKLEYRLFDGRNNYILLDAVDQIAQSWTSNDSKKAKLLKWLASAQLDSSNEIANMTS
ncbi:hypothetical protein [Roseateles sp. PN1]|uniref:hypothetical protein n=1 Tax=Roseateles sp. PN1 TaxID=3137372 RepID=UPI003138F20D